MKFIRDTCQFIRLRDQGLGFPNIRGIFLRGHNKDYSILESILGSHYFTKLPDMLIRRLCRGYTVRGIWGDRAMVK